MIITIIIVMIIIIKTTTITMTMIIKKIMRIAKNETEFYKKQQH